MLPEARLGEAAKQINIVIEDGELTETEAEWLQTGLRQVRATQAAIETGREARDDAEVLDDA